MRNTQDRFTESVAAARHLPQVTSETKTPFTKGHSRLLLSLMAVLVMLLAACGQSPRTDELPGEGEPIEVEDIATLEWTGAAIGYVDDEAELDLSSVDDGVVVTGSGADIWGTRDEFFFTYTTLQGDGSLELRVDELSASDPWSKAGVMIRESTAPESKNALIHISAGNGSVYQARVTDGDRTTNEAGADPTAEVGSWLRLTRVGDVLTGELSADGENWTEVGTYEIAMQEEVLIGMAVTAHASHSKATAKFKDVKYRRGRPDHAGPKPQEPAPTDPPQPTEPTPPSAPGSSFVLPPATLYVATNGSDSNSGRSVNDPLRTVTRAASMVKPGDVVYIRGGVYPIQVKFTTSGTSSAPIVWASYPGETAIFDGSDRRPALDSDRIWVEGASWNVFANFEVRNGPRQGIYVHSGSNDNFFTGLVVHGNNGSGIQNANSNRNRYEYLTIYDNFDQVNTRGETGQDADGIGMSSGDGNVISHVVSFRNSDDGIDAWKSTNTIIEYSVSHSNGRGSHGNGNGIKAGGGGHDNRTIVRNSIAFNNKAVGFTQNSGRNIQFLNNTAFNNGNYAFLGHDTVTFKNNLAIGGTLMLSSSTQQNNSWNLNISDPRIASQDPSSPDFLALRADSPAIDAGVDVGLEYSGSAPDLGALQYGVTIASFGDAVRSHIASASIRGDQLALGY